MSPRESSSENAAPTELRYGLVGGPSTIDRLREALLALGASADRITELRVEPESSGGASTPPVGDGEPLPSDAQDVVLFASVADATTHGPALARRYPLAALLVGRDAAPTGDPSTSQRATPPAAPLHDDFDPADPAELARAIVRARRLVRAEAGGTDAAGGEPSSTGVRVRGIEAELKERIKELNTLYTVTQTLSLDDLSLDERLRAAACAIPAGWRYPDVAECRIVVDDCSHESSPYRETDWRMRSPLSADAGSEGYVEVCYREAPPALDGDAFLPEEHTLLAACSRQVSAAIRRDRMEKSLQQSQKLQAVGRLAGGVAHDFNNLLTGIGGLTHLLLLDTPDGDPRRADLSEILRATERAAQLTRQLLAFSRKEVVQPVDLDVGDLLRRFIPMLERMAGSAVQVRVTLAPETLIVHIDETQLEQVLLNLVANARDAMPDGGEVCISLKAVDVDHDAARRTNPPVAAGRFACLEVVDPGTGMDSDTLERAFEPFFTTRPVGSGSGLGLSTVYGIVSDAGGAITAQSEPGAGSTFCLLLPLMMSSAAAPEAAAQSEASAPTSQLAGDHDATPVIVVVDDDASVAQLVTRILERAGERVIAFEDPAAAVAVLEDATQPVRAVITDVAMPVMNGIELTALARRARPDLPVLLMSGYVAESARAEAERLPFIRKPFSPEELLTRLQRLLGS